MTSDDPKKTSRPRPVAKGAAVRSSGQLKHSKKPALEVAPTTLWDYPSQHYGKDLQGDPDYIGATPSYVIWNLLQRYTKVGDRVVDPMCGGGTTIDVAKDLGREPLGFDLVPSRPDITAADARSLSLKSKSVDFAFIDPPYSTHVDYSDNEACIGKLSAREPEYYQSLDLVIKELHRVLKDKAFMALYVSDSAQKGKSFCPIGFELFGILSAYLRPVDIVAVTRHNRKLKLPHYCREAVEGNFFMRGFNYLFIMQKHDEWMQDRPVLRGARNEIVREANTTKKRRTKKRRGSRI